MPRARTSDPAEPANTGTAVPGPLDAGPDADPDLEAVVEQMPEAPEFAAARQLGRVLGRGSAAPRAVDAEIEALWREMGRLQRRFHEAPVPGDSHPDDGLVADVAPAGPGLPVMHIRAEAHRLATARAGKRRRALALAALLVLATVAAVLYLRF